MVSCLSCVYLLSSCLIGLNAGSMPNLCSTTSLGIPGISDIYHVKASRFSQRKVMSMSSYLVSRSVLRRSFLSVSSRSTGTSLSMAPFFLLPTNWSVVGWFEVEPTNALFFSAGSQGVPLVGGLGAAVLTRVLPSCVLATLAVNSCASFSPKHPACVSATFSHVSASR
jgi:hypothetical protein